MCREVPVVHLSYQTKGIIQKSIYIYCNLFLRLNQQPNWHSSRSELGYSIIKNFKRRINICQH
nr:MAG TPA: hypothetical protein [Caudoviricetes sp.]DAK61680.1 MAG TPA: hypothetical protein [Bacteriophage sp.]